MSEQSFNEEKLLHNYADSTIQLGMIGANIEHEE